MVTLIRKNISIINRTYLPNISYGKKVIFVLWPGRSALGSARVSLNNKVRKKAELFLTGRAVSSKAAVTIFPQFCFPPAGGKKTGKLFYFRIFT